VGRLLAGSLGWRFLDADDFHSPENIDKMRRGIALTDTDRAPWLAAMCKALADAYATNTKIALACSALKDEYRRALIPKQAKDSARFVYLHASAQVLQDRLANRVGHYAGPDLLQSQLETLEEPTNALWVDASQEPVAIVAEVRRVLAL
jgi:gluconokinase